LNAEAEERAGEVQFAIEREKFEAEGLAARSREIAAASGSRRAARAAASNGRKGGRIAR
jgi:circadian clock protein KaiC